MYSVTELKGLTLIFSSSVVFLWKMYNRLLLNMTPLSKILGISQLALAKLNRLMILSTLS